MQLNSDIVILYKEGDYEMVDRVVKKHILVTVHCKTFLVHYKDKCEAEEAELAYQIPCPHCHQSYIGKMGTQFKTRRDEREQ